jgi:hypothetical protein
MSASELQKLLRPDRCDNLNEIEPFDEYYSRVHPILPNWPECAVKNWLHRHFNDAFRDYGWLGFDQISFEQIGITRDEVYSLIGTFKLKRVDGWGEKIYSCQGAMQSWLQKSMLDYGTWPVPIIVLENLFGKASPHGEILAQPLHLLEGHLRLGYFRNMYRREPERLSKTHLAWIVRLPKPNA